MRDSRSGVVVTSLLAVIAASACGSSKKEETTTTTEPPVEETSEAAACGVDICATYGPAVPKVASDITDKAAADPQFAKFFEPLVKKGPDAIAAFKKRLADFIAVAYGCADPSTYTGADMKTAHAGMGITSQQYDDFITLVAGVLAANGVPESDINACFAPPLVAPEFKAMIVEQ